MDLYKEYQQLMEELYYLDSTIANLQWDQEVMLPKESADYRSKQIAYLSSLSHEKFTNRNTGKLLQSTLKEDLNEDQRLNVEKTLYDYEKSILLPSLFIKNRSELTSKAYTAWIKARTQNDAWIFTQSFEPLLDLKREEAELRGYDTHPYNALLNVYDKGLNVETLDPLFINLDKDLNKLIKWVTDKQEDHRSLLMSSIPHEKQWQFSLEILKAMNFDFDRGRQDISEHPFTISLAPNDIRLTTHSSKENLSPIIWGSIHEGGHALYEQGLPKNKYKALPLSQAASLSIHESQARFWEIQVGKSNAFWTYFFPKMKKTYEKYGFHASLNDFMKATHFISPNKIRTEADELHYHRHIIIRYELEKKLMSGQIEVNEIEGKWNEIYADKMGVEIRNPKEGVLQDVHWAHGGLGYFPTYTLGSIYAAELYDQIYKEVEDIPRQMQQGKFEEIYQWLAQKIYQHGRRYESQPLMEKILGRKPVSGSLVKIFEQKFKDLYNI